MPKPSEQVVLGPVGPCLSTRCYDGYYGLTVAQLRSAAGPEVRALLCDSMECGRYHPVLSWGPEPEPTAVFAELVKALAAQQGYDSAMGRCSRTDPTDQQCADLDEAARELAGGGGALRDRAGQPDRTESEELMDSDEMDLGAERGTLLRASLARQQEGEALHRIVLVERNHGGVVHPFVVWFQIQRESGNGTYFAEGDYCSTYEEGSDAFERRLKRGYVEANSTATSGSLSF